MKHIKRSFVCIYSGLAMALGLCLGLQVSVYAAPLPEAASVHQYTLKNGMTLIVRPDHRAPTAVHMLWVRVGSMDEVDGTSGLVKIIQEN